MNFGTPAPRGGLLNTHCFVTSLFVFRGKVPSTLHMSCLYCFLHVTDLQVVLNGMVQSSRFLIAVINHLKLSITVSSCFLRSAFLRIYVILFPKVLEPDLFQVFRCRHHLILPRWVATFFLIALPALQASLCIWSHWSFASHPLSLQGTRMEQRPAVSSQRRSDSALQLETRRWWWTYSRSCHVSFVGTSAYGRSRLRVGHREQIYCIFKVSSWCHGTR